MKLFGYLAVTLAVLAWLESDLLAAETPPPFSDAAALVEDAARTVGWSQARSAMNQAFRDWLEGYWEEINLPDLHPQPRSSREITEEAPLRLLILGDSLASFHLPNAFNALAAAGGRVQVASLSRVSASLTNPVRLDFLREVPRFLALQASESGRPFDAVVVLMGANDPQPMRHAGRALRFGTSEWNTEFRTRVRSLLEILSSEAEKIYWLQLPPMRDPSLEAGVRSVELLFRQELEGFPDSSFLELRSVLADDQGRYAPVGVVEGRQVVLRARDGVHFSSAAARLLARAVWERLVQDFEGIERPPASTATDPDAAGPNAPAAPAWP